VRDVPGTVAALVRLHVLAKRYLVTAEPGYRTALDAVAYCWRCRAPR
jgi:predicted HD phosphohydrolase